MSCNHCQQYQNHNRFLRKREKALSGKLFKLQMLFALSLCVNLIFIVRFL